LPPFEHLRRKYPGRSDRGIIRVLCEELLAEAEAEPPVPIERIASLRGIADIKEREQPWAGALQPQDAHFVVWVRSGDGYERQRFTVCHETGHTFFAGFADAPQFRCNGATTTLEERCDIAASELLLPYRFFSTDIDGAAFDFSSIEHLADQYEASIEATSLRFIDLWREPAAFIVLRERHKPAERGCESACEPKLRVEYAYTQGDWPFIRRFKSVDDESCFMRALIGELIDEKGDLGDLVGEDIGPVHVIARRYGGQPRVLALVRKASLGTRGGVDS
jgi:hypothetical protein